MIRTDHTIDILRERARNRIETNRIAGQDTRHNRAANLRAIQNIVDNDSHYTWDIRGLDKFTFAETLEAIASITDCSHDPEVTAGGGYISPSLTLQALEGSARKIASVARKGGTFLLGTGHPGSLLVFYVELARLIRDWGGIVHEPARGSTVPPNLELGYGDGIAVTTDRASLMHTHDHRAMDLMLEELGQVDLVIGDHGYAGGAINAGVPVISVMDTNDPALALAEKLGADLLIIPMDDNRPLGAYLPIVESIREFGEWYETELDIHLEVVSNGEKSPVNYQINQQLADAEQFVVDRYPSQDGLDGLVQGFMESYRDQLVQAALESDAEETANADPLRDLVLYTRIHDAVHRTIERLCRAAPVQIEGSEIQRYLDTSPHRESNKNVEQR